MQKFIVIEVGSTNTKSYLYDNGKITEYPQKTIPFKVNFKDGKLDPSDVQQLIAHVNNFKHITENIFVYGTSIFRSLDVKSKSEFLCEFKAQTGKEFNIVSNEQELEYTIKGVILGNDYNGRLAVMIGEGGSIEVCIVENKKIIETVYNNYGSLAVTEKFKEISDYKPNLTMQQIENYCMDLLKDVQNKSDILVLAGGDFKFFYECMDKEFLEPNKFYSDTLQSYVLSISNSDIIDQRFIFEESLEHYQEKYNSYSKIWWCGARAIRPCVRAIIKKCDAKYIIPTKINMCMGIINELSNPLDK